MSHMDAVQAAEDTLTHREAMEVPDIEPADRTVGGERTEVATAIPKRQTGQTTGIRPETEKIPASRTEQLAKHPPMRRAEQNPEIEAESAAEGVISEGIPVSHMDAVQVAEGSLTHREAPKVSDIEAADMPRYHS